MNTNGTFIVEGGHRLSGEIIPQGAKNEALQILSATLLTEEAVRVENLPDIEDVNKLLDLIAGLGADVERHDRQTVTITAKNINLDYVLSESYVRDAQRIRGSVMLIAPLLNRYGQASLPKPGGDKIGRRRLDTHLLGLQALGADFEYDEERNIYAFRTDGLKGTFIHMDEISVTGTANVLMAAVLADGETTIYNAACEPYLQQLSHMLTSMGAKIEGIGSNLLKVQGVSRLGGCTHRMLPDMIEVGSFIGLAAITQSDITIKDVRLDKLGIIPRTFERLGIQMEYLGDDIHIPPQEHYEVQNFLDGGILTIYDAPWPGFTPDLMSIALVTAIQARGSVLFHQKMFESRLFFVDKLIDMGAQIILCDPHRATVIGMDRRNPLRGIRMTSPDIRAGVSLLIAALSAEGTSRIDNIYQIDRGYQDIDTRLRALGAKIIRED
ncbi:UDP-N-acetylglucosamine 1-carboxyvinyltransferase [Neolewinella litorea]|uniref:UDP-N-acetylglucosamine 1-carboxyvinyltransferase n=1 Tax=Neolewinella litorea TaxID=2562452 RepID=A0A4S4NRB3_9BACT|nr:UDP-N-acetylglucosamine 1-carboxyvinyltransferase [Neolewinella litorea]THH41735.1 UDP-N-acetylglucosamine 1-carboxyvinyltransferase [Neolewinella litorea]